MPLRLRLGTAEPGRLPLRSTHLRRTEELPPAAPRRHVRGGRLQMARVARSASSPALTERRVALFTNRRWAERLTSPAHCSRVHRCQQSHDSEGFAKKGAGDLRHGWRLLLGLLPLRRSCSSSSGDWTGPNWAGLQDGISAAPRRRGGRHDSGVRGSGLALGLPARPDRAGRAGPALLRDHRRIHDGAPDPARREIVRPYLIARRHDVRTSSAFASIISSGWSIC